MQSRIVLPEYNCVPFLVNKLLLFERFHKEGVMMRGLISAAGHIFSRILNACFVLVHNDGLRNIQTLHDLDLKFLDLCDWQLCNVWVIHNL